MKIGLLCCYPLLIHLAIALELPALKILAIILLTIGIAYEKLINKHFATWLLVSTIIAVAIITAQIDMWKYVFYTIPVLLPASISAIFFSTLLANKEPLVTAIAERARGPLAPELRIYTRKVTQVWAYLLAAMTVWSALLSLSGHLWLWSLVTNFLNYVVIALLFIGEFCIRQKYFKQHDHPNFKQYIHIVINSWRHKHPS